MYVTHRLAAATVDSLGGGGQVDELADRLVSDTALHEEALEGAGTLDVDDGRARLLAQGGAHLVG